MDLRAFNYGANAVAFIKNNKKYGMICAWAMQADYDKVLLLLGAQSVTGKNISKGDIIGVSSLNENQQFVANALGSSHSDEGDKFSGLNYNIIDTAITIKDASVSMVVEVIDILHLEGIESDNLIYGTVKSYTESNVDKYTLKNK